MAYGGWLLAFGFWGLCVVGLRSVRPSSIPTSVTSIDIGFNSIGQAASLELLAAMKGKQMVSIGMAMCELGVEGSKVVAEMISVMASLTYLRYAFESDFLVFSPQITPKSFWVCVLSGVVWCVLL